MKKVTRPLWSTYSSDFKTKVFRCTRGNTVFIVNNMAKAVLKFDLTDPDDRIEHLRAIKATDMAIVIWEFVNNTRKGMEFRIEEEKYDAYTVLDKILDEFSDRLDEHGIIIDDLVR